MQIIKLILELLPELIKLIKWASSQIEKGITLNEIKKSVNSISGAFEKVESNPQQAAADLDSVFTGIHFDRVQESRNRIRSTVSRPTRPKPKSNK